MTKPYEIGLKELNTLVSALEIASSFAPQMADQDKEQLADAVSIIESMVLAASSSEYDMAPLVDKHNKL